MYLSRHFEELRPEVLHEIMRENGFATLVTIRDGVPFASHIPVLIDGGDAGVGLKIRGHVARTNPQSKPFADGEPVLAIFHGPHGYVSPAWYGKPEKNVPTWNYAVVHARGRARLLDAAGLRAQLKDLVDTHERGFESPWRLESLAPDLMDKLLNAIVGFEIAVDEVHGSLKLSQNRSPDDQQRVRERLAASADPQARRLAAWMERLAR